MPTIVIKDRKRTLKLSKRESDALLHAGAVCADIAHDFEPLHNEGESAAKCIGNILAFVSAAKQPE